MAASTPGVPNRTFGNRTLSVNPWIELSLIEFGVNRTQPNNEISETQSGELSSMEFGNRTESSVQYGWAYIDTKYSI